MTHARRYSADKGEFGKEQIFPDRSQEPNFLLERDLTRSSLREDEG